MLKNGDTQKAKYCFLRAVALGPNIPFTLIRAADFHFTVGENGDALRLLAPALALDPGYWDSIFSDFEKRGIRIDEVLRYGLPADSRVFKEYFRRLMYQKRTSDAAKTWDWINSRRYADDKLADEYVDFLIHDGKYDHAQQAWARYVNGREKGYPTSNLLFNGDFESNPTGSRFDWTIDPAQGAEIQFDREIHYSGLRSLRIKFDGRHNVSNIGVRQIVFLKPGRYRFAAYIRTKELTTDEGFAFSIVDPEAKHLSFTTESMIGTNDWKLVEHTFQVLPKTGLIQLSLTRKPSLRFDNLIRGTVWIDQVSISPESEIAKLANR